MMLIQQISATIRSQVRDVGGGRGHYAGSGRGYARGGREEAGGEGRLAWGKTLLGTPSLVDELFSHELTLWKQGCQVSKVVFVDDDGGGAAIKDSGYRGWGWSCNKGQWVQGMGVELQ